jgi:DNA-binding response OmpR family regulator
MSQIQDPSSKEEHLTRKVLLIVEDDPGTAAFLVMAIAQESPYRPLVAETGERALELVQHVKPALFILDYVLGTMNGLHLYDSLHAQQGLEAIPAIILSASVEQYQDEIEQRHLLGLAKPFELDELLLSIEQALSVPQEQR